MPDKPDLRSPAVAAHGDGPSPDTYDIIAMAASAGGIQALSRVLAGLPADLPAAVLIVQHLDPDHESHLSWILGRETALRVKEAEAGERIAPGGVYVAPPNRHLLVDPDGTLSLTRTEFVHFVRPSADLLFESVAASYGRRAIAVVLSGTGVDGSRGITAVRKRDGVVIAQDEESSEHFGMPGAAIRTGDVNRVLPLEEIAPALVDLAGQAVSA